MTATETLEQHAIASAPKMPPAPGAPGAPDARAGKADARLAELADMIRQYNELTENLRDSHVALHGEVLRLQSQLASTDAQLQRSRRLAALGEMAAGIAHEIRNPLAAIRLYAHMIEEDLDAAVGESSALTPTSLRDTLGRATQIVSAVRGLDAIVNDVLSFAREIRPRMRSCDAMTLLDRAVSAHRPAIDQADVIVRCDVGDGDGVQVVADADLLHQALLNLVRNAVDAMTGVHSEHEGENATPYTERVLTLAAGREAAGDESGCAYVWLTVADTGPGIAEEHIDRIFNPFFTTRGTGTGLGLAIVHRIIDAHGGTICVHNEETGAVFELRLPVREEGDSSESRNGVDV